MERKNIFELQKDRTNLSDIKNVIISIFEDQSIITIDSSDGRKYNYSIKSFADKYAFKTWKARGFNANVDDFLDHIDYYHIKNCYNISLSELLITIEAVYNIWNIVDRYICLYNQQFIYALNQIILDDNYNYLKKSMDQALALYNYEAYYFENEDNIILVEPNPAAWAVSEINEDVSDDVLKYNQYGEEGDLEAKRKILEHLGLELEKSENIFKGNNMAGFYGDITYLLNNFCIRHPNESNKVKISDSELETIFDELYQMELLAFLELDNLERKKYISNLKERFPKSKK